MQPAGATARDTEVRLPRVTKVKNKQPAPRQITAEQIIREAKEIQLEEDIAKPKTIITDQEELNEYRLKKRKEFEDMIRRVGKFNGRIWVKVRLAVGVLAAPFFLFTRQLGHSPLLSPSLCVLLFLGSFEVLDDDAL